MKSLVAIFCLTALASSQPSPGQTALKPTPRLGFEQIGNAPGIVDTDALSTGRPAKSSAAKATQAEHEAALMREFTEAYNQTQECDRVVLMSKGDNAPDFALQIKVTSHDTAGQKPVWNWVLRDVRRKILMPAGNDDSARQAARSICTAVKNQAEQDRQRTK